MLSLSLPLFSPLSLIIFPFSSVVDLAPACKTLESQGVLEENVGQNIEGMDGVGGDGHIRENKVEWDPLVKKTVL